MNSVAALSGAELLGGHQATMVTARPPRQSSSSNGLARDVQANARGGGHWAAREAIQADRSIAASVAGVAEEDGQ